ncbi:MAG: ParB/RepB/Spo0J family partition protein [Bdellovibrionales bacterium]
MAQTAQPARLGRGLSALLGDTDASYQASKQSHRTEHGSAALAALANAQAVAAGEPLAQATAKHSPQTMPVTWLVPCPFQPRRHFDESALQGLADSIRERGILEPLLVRPVEDAKDRYEIIAGERRWRASQIAGLHDVPVVVRKLTDREALEFGLIENIQREGLSPLEEAEGYKRLIEEFSHTQDDLAKIVGRSRPHITNMLRILTLPETILQMIEKGDLTMGHARAVITARDPLEVAQMVVKKGLNVRQAEALAKKMNDNPQIHKRKANTEADANIVALEKDIERSLGLKVKIQTQGKSGTLTLYYHSLDQLEDLILKLKGAEN